MDQEELAVHRMEDDGGVSPPTLMTYYDIVEFLYRWMGIEDMLPTLEFVKYVNRVTGGPY